MTGERLGTGALRRTRGWIGCLMLLTACASAAADDVPAALEEEARGVAAQFAAALKPRLLAAIEAGGPTHAVTVCADEAPAIAAKLSATSGWQVSRVSLKPRNPQAAPDAWEAEVLRAFAAQKASGETPAPVSARRDGEIRLLSPQLTAPLCLTCHGAPSGALAATLERLYPEDMATGYSLGQVRGAISVRRALQE